MTFRQIRSTVLKVAIVLTSSPFCRINLIHLKSTAMAESSVDPQTKPLHKTDLYFNARDEQWPIVYSPKYNIKFLGMENLHPFDAGKWGRVFNKLKEKGMVTEETVVEPREASQEDLLFVHTKNYLNNLKWSSVVARITEVLPVALVPNFIVQRVLLKPLRYQTGGTILAAKLAMERGWAINIGGGFHHAHSQDGGGFCVYADITLAIRFLMANNKNVKKAMIIDLDAHQGNGHERDFMDDENVYIVDVYNGAIYPGDFYARKGINKKANCLHHTKDPEYLEKVKRTIEEALNEFTPDIVIYNAGTDILLGDPLGNLDITDQGIIQRDEIVFTKVRAKNIPIVMVTSGGYTRETADIIADSILNLNDKDLISMDNNKEIKDIFPPEYNEESYRKKVHQLKEENPVLVGSEPETSDSENVSKEPKEKVKAEL